MLLENKKINLIYLGRVEAEGAYADAYSNPQKYIEPLEGKKEHRPNNMYQPLPKLDRTHFVVNQDAKEFWFFESYRGDCVDVYTRGFLVKDDETFCWERKNHGKRWVSCRWSEVRRGCLRFAITADIYGTAVINVRYNGKVYLNPVLCKIRISENADNEAIINAIDQFISQFKAEVKAIKAIA